MDPATRHTARTAALAALAASTRDPAFTVLGAGIGFATVRGVVAGTGRLRLTDPRDGSVYDQPMLTVDTVAAIRVRPMSEMPEGTTASTEDGALAVLVGSTVRFAVLLVAPPGGPASRLPRPLAPNVLVDEGTTLTPAPSSAGTVTVRSWDSFELTALAPGTVRVRHDVVEILAGWAGRICGRVARVARPGRRVSPRDLSSTARRLSSSRRFTM